MREAIPEASERRICELLDVSRSTCQPGRKRNRADFCVVPAVNPELSERIRQLIQEHPTFGYRRIWAILKNREGIAVNRKAVYRILKVKRWFVHHRTKTPKPRVQGSRSVAEKINERWAIDITHIPCGKDGWGHLVALVDWQFYQPNHQMKANRLVFPSKLQLRQRLPIFLPIRLLQVLVENQCR